MLIFSPEDVTSQSNQATELCKDGEKQWERKEREEREQARVASCVHVCARTHKRERREGGKIGIGKHVRANFIAPFVMNMSVLS